MFFLLSMLLISSLFLFIPFFSGLFDSYFSFAVLVFASLVVVFLSNALSEYASTFTRTSGGFFVYLSKTYNRWTGFFISAALLFGIYLVSLYFLFSVFKLLFVSKILILLSTLLTIIFIHYLLYYFKKKTSVLLLVLLFIPFLILTIVTLFLGINFSLSLPIFTWSFSSWSLIVALVFSIATISYFIISLLYSEVSNAEEIVHDHASKSYLIFFLFLLLSLFFFAGSSYSTNTITSFFQIFSTFWLFKLGIILSVISFFTFAWFALLRLLFSFSKEKLFFLSVASLDKKNRPVKASIIQIFILSFLSIILFFVSDFSLSLLLYLMLFLIISASLLVFGIFVLRKRFPDLERPFAVKSYVFSSFLFLFVSLVLIYFFLRFVIVLNSSFATVIILLFFLLSLFYFIFEYYYSEAMFALINSLTCRCSLLQRIRAGLFSKKFLLKHIPNISGLRVLEFGAHSGLFTKELISRIGNSGKLFVTDQSDKCIKYLSKKFSSKNKNGHSIVFLNDYPSSIHPSVSKINFFFSVGMFWHLTYVDRVLQQLNIIMPSNSLFFISTPSRFLGFPLKFWTSDDIIKKLFFDEGFAINIHRYSNFFVSYVLIVGVRKENVELLTTWYSQKQ